MIMGIWDNHTFWVVQLFGLLATALGYIRTQKTDRKQFNLYHTYLCIPLMAQYFLLDAWFMFSLCAVGSIRTLLLYTDWGWERRTMVVAMCLAVPLMGSVYTASHWVDWFLVVATVIGVGGEALKNFLHLRIASVICNFAWFLNNLVFGSYVSALSQMLNMFGHFKVMIRDYGVWLRFKAFLGCQKSELAYLQAYGSPSY